MKKFVMSMFAVLFLVGWGCVITAGAVDVSGIMKAGYPVDTNTDVNDVFNIAISPNYILEGNVTITNIGNCPMTFDLGLDVLENVSTVLSLTATYPITPNIGVFAEHNMHDMKAGRSDYDVTWAGGYVSFGSK